MTDVLAHDVGGLTFGWDDGDEPYPLVGSDGLEDFTTTTNAPSGLAGDGQVATPSWVNAGEWVTEFDIASTDPTEWRALRDAVKKMAARCRTGENAYAIRYTDEPTRTRFCRVVHRSIPQADMVAYQVDHFITASIAFASFDPYTYLPEVESSIDGDGWTITPDGWEATPRFQWVVNGACTNPRLTVHVDGKPDQIVRFVGAVGAGQNLNWQSSPGSMVATVGGPEFDKYGQFDGGNSNTPPAKLVLPPDEDVSFVFSCASGDATSTFRFLPALL